MHFLKYVIAFAITNLIKNEADMPTDTSKYKDTRPKYIFLITILTISGFKKAKIKKNLKIQYLNKF